MKEILRRIFVVLWIIAGFFGLIALADAVQSNNEALLYGWLFSCGFLCASQYILTGTPNPVSMFDPPN